MLLIIRKKTSPIFNWLTYSLILCLFSFTPVKAQMYSRIQAGFTIKESGAYKKVTVGTVYYDKFDTKIVYDIRYPQKEIIVVTDTVIYRIVDGAVAEKKNSTGIIPFSIFHLALNGDLDFYGLKDSPYTLTATETKDDQVITTWMPPLKQQEYLGKVMLSQKEGLVFGMLSYMATGTLLSKQFFEEYQNVKGVRFPHKVVQIMNTDTGEQHKITTYRDVIINNADPQSKTYYHYSVPLAD